MKTNNNSHFKIKSLNKEKIFNKLSKIFNIYNIKEYEGYTEFEVDENDGKKVEKFLLENKSNILEIKHNGIKYKFFKILKMWGIISGCLMSLLFCFLQNLFVWKIDVWGCENIKESEIIDFVKSSFTNYYKENINTKNIEIELKNNFEDISSVSVAIVGQSLIININEAIIPEEMQGEYEPLVSNYDGIITSIDLVQGTVNVKVGDIVKKGDVLVYPYIFDGDGERMPIQPKAEIKAEVWIKNEETFYEYQIKEIRTGNKIECSSVSLFGLEIYSNVNNNNFENYQTEKNSVFLSKNNFLPLVYTKITFYETKTIEIERNFEDEKENIIEKLRQNSLIYLTGNEIILNENCTINESNGIYFISFILTVEKDLGEGYGYQFPQS